MSLRHLVERYLKHQIQEIHRVKNGINKSFEEQPAHIFDVPCAWQDHDEVLNVGDGEVRTKALVRVLPEVDVQAKDILVKDGQRYRVLVVGSSKPDFEGNYLFKILKVS